MSGSIPKQALIKRIRGALKHNEWHLVAAEDDWYLNDRKVATWYVLDNCGDVVGHYFDLVTLERDLCALREPAGRDAMAVSTDRDAVQPSSLPSVAEATTAQLDQQDTTKPNQPCSQEFLDYLASWLRHRGLSPQYRGMKKLGFAKSSRLCPKDSRQA